MSRGYGKYRKGNCQASFHFDKLFKENSNCPSAARSAGTVGKWGITSFTSIRALNGICGSENDKKPNDQNSSVPKPKKFFKSRDTTVQETTPAVFSESTKSYSSTTKKPKLSASPEQETIQKSPPTPTEPCRKFFVSKTTISKDNKTVLTSSSFNNVKRDETKPPIVLRICRGKSQLLSDSEESETTVTPTTTPSTSSITSPRSVGQKSPGSIRITRSTRRSMQQDPSSSPATADTPADTFGSFFLSPKKDIDLSPQYIPAEKYEQERKAMYASLLGTSISSSEASYPTQSSLFETTPEKIEAKENVVPRSSERESANQQMQSNYSREQTNEGMQKSKDNVQNHFVSDTNTDPVPMELEYEKNNAQIAEVKEAEPPKLEAIPKISIIVRAGEIRMKKQNENDISSFENKKFEIKIKRPKENESNNDNKIYQIRIVKTKDESDEHKHEENVEKPVPETKTYEIRSRKPKEEKEDTSARGETIKTYLRTRKLKEKKEDNVAEVQVKKQKEGKEENCSNNEIKTYEMRTRKPKEEKPEENVPAIENKPYEMRLRKQKEEKEENITLEENKLYETRARRSKELRDENINTNESKRKQKEEQEDEGAKPEIEPEPDLQKVENNKPKTEDASPPEIKPYEMRTRKPKEEKEETPSIEDVKSLITERRITRNALKSKALEETKAAESLEDTQSDNLAPVKIVISKKKGSIFKSRSMVTDASKKRRALYKHKWADESKDMTKSTEETAKDKNNTNTSSFEFQNAPLVRIPKSDVDGESDLLASIKCTRNDKGFYTVVRNVKKAHQIQEIGEFQEFNDDVEYILDALQDNNPISTRCLSAITLASKCMVPAFRMHVRAHGIVAKFFKALHDATKDQSLGLCTATVMFVLSQDRLNMDLDRDCLELMLNLLESDVSYQQALDVCGLSSAQLEKNKQKVKELCAEIQSQGHAKHINLENITVGQLAMETLLSLTSKRAGEWFKEELRELGGLEHIIKTIYECCRQVSDYVVSWTDVLLDKLRKIDRCMRVLENVTSDNEENQVYILQYKDGMILETLVQLYRLCDTEIPLYPVTDVSDKESAGAIIREALLVTLKVLINLTHHFSKNSFGGALIGSQPGIIEASLHLLLQVPHYIPEQKKFELGVLVLMLLINLIQDNNGNKKMLIEAKAPADFESAYTCDKSAVEALIAQFYQWEESARMAEKRTDAILDGEKDGETQNAQSKTNEEFIEETVDKLLQKAGIHMEFTFLASYIVMLLGFLIMDNAEYEGVVRRFLKNNNFSMMVDLLNKFFKFMNLTASSATSSMCAIKATERVLKYLEDCDKRAEEEVVKDSSEAATPECMDLSYSVVQ